MFVRPRTVAFDEDVTNAEVGLCERQRTLLGLSENTLLVREYFGQIFVGAEGGKKCKTRSGQMVFCAEKASAALFEASPTPFARTTKTLRWKPDRGFWIFGRERQFRYDLKISHLHTAFRAI